jgi:Alternative complex III, ActD subunit
MSASPASKIFGIAAQFDSPEAITEAAELIHQHGYIRIDAFTPFPIEELSEIVFPRPSKVPLIMLIGGILGGATGYFGLQLFSMAYHYPFNVGGRPLNSWPLYIPVTFELTVLISSFFGVIGLLIVNGLPRLHHPMFGVAGFERASVDRFFLLIERTDPKFDEGKIRQLLTEAKAQSITEVYA